mgnify:CR=1 FL=1
MVAYRGPQARLQNGGSMKRGRIFGAVATFALAGALACAGCAGGGQGASTDAGKASVLDPADPVQVELWTYYNGTQQQAFEDLVKEFNAGRGKDTGVVVTSSSQGGVNDLAAAVTDSAQELVGSEAMPDAFLSYSDTASVIDELGRVADLSPYLTDDEKAQYVDSFIEEGDINGDGTVNADDCTIIGRGQPLHTGGFNNTFEFFGFDLNVFFQWNYGNDILNAARTQFVRGKSEVGYNRWKEYCGRWTPENPMSDIPRVGGWGSSQYSTFEVEDGSFLRLKNLSLGYTLPSKITKKFFVQKLRVYFSAQNLVTWSNYSGYDPEVSTKNTALTPGYDWSAYPRSRVYNFGINVVF